MPNEFWALREFEAADYARFSGAEASPDGRHPQICEGQVVDWPEGDEEIVEGHVICIIDGSGVTLLGGICLMHLESTYDLGMLVLEWLRQQTRDILSLSDLFKLGFQLSAWE